MKKTCKKLVSVLLAAIMVFSLFTIVPFSVGAASAIMWPVPGHTAKEDNFHKGNAIDIRDSTINGATVVAAMGGTVTTINLCGEQHYGSDHTCHGFGTGLVITGDDGRIYQYAHMTAGSIPSNVYYGARVEMGQKIGTVGTTGNSTGPHLHFGISLGAYYNESGINPYYENYINDPVLPESVDLGTDFYAYIINTYAWKHLTNDSTNVTMRSETGEANQVWKFYRQNDGSYKITNCLDGRALDVLNFGTTDGTNVGVCDNNDSTAQRWYIYGESGAYSFRAACGNLVLDIAGGSTDEGANAQMWTNNDTTAQKFQVWKLSEPSQTFVYCTAGTNYRPTSIWWLQTDNTRYYDVKIWKNSLWEGEAYKILWGVTDTSCMVNLPAGYYEAYVDTRNNYSTTMSSNIVKFTVTEDEPKNIGEDFYAALLVNKNWVNVSNVNSNVELAAITNASAEQIWHFMRQSDGSYIIVNCLDGNALDVSNAENNNGTNVQVHEINYTDAQKWYIYGRWSGEYYFKPKCADKVLDVSGGKNVVGDNIQIWELNYSDAQKFAIWEVEPAEKSELRVECIKNETCFNWTKSDNTNEYEVKIWKEATLNGELFIKYNTSETKYNVVLPAGNYIACVCSKNNFSIEQSNLVTFTIEYTNAIGDIDGDGIISVSDATTLQKQLADGVELDDEMLEVADANGDGIVSVSDATLIQKYLAGNASSLG